MAVNGSNFRIFEKSSPGKPKKSQKDTFRVFFFRSDDQTRYESLQKAPFSGEQAQVHAHMRH